MLLPMEEAFSGEKRDSVSLEQQIAAASARHPLLIFLPSPQTLLCCLEPYPRSILYTQTLDSGWA